MQETYIDKLANQFAIETIDKLLETLMTGELLLNEEKATKVSMHIYQKKTDSILFAVIIIRSDVAFSASKLTQFNQNLKDSHQEAAN